MGATSTTLNYHSNDLAGAIEAQKKAHENDPTNVDYMVSLGEFLRQDEKIEEAITILSAATKLNPKMLMHITTWVFYCRVREV